ncbi:VCBS domain-containing protein, partial [Planktotalea sp.]|uniref:VCBS domain-containing protein n=1 Tax=Planktotalea sp. TaxID=2029877 RepID=UPI0032996163
MQNILEEDIDNTFAWAQRVSVFDAFGFLISRQTTFDDGQVRAETLTDGVTTQTDWSDPNNQVVWSLKTTSKDPSTGYITTKTVTLDDGQSIMKTFNNNVQSSQVIADVDDNFGFTTKTKLFDSSGQITSYQINYDDGRTSMTSYDDGVRTASTLTDTASAYDWDTRFFDYDDATGKLISVTTTFDSGVVETVLAAVGPISKSVVQHDNMDRFAWETVTSQYDGTGQLQNKRVVFDDGVESDKQFTDGVQATLQLTDVDDAHNWATQSKTYDTAGRLATETRTMDDGRVITRNFDAGTQTSKSVLDQNDQYNWARQDWTYDAAGLPSSKVTEYDNGMRETVNFSVGIIESRTQLDLADVKNWQSIQSVFADNGTLLYREITDDDGNKRFLDARKQVIITGGTDAQVSEDAAPQLEATGQIEIVAGYRGSGSFTAQSGVLGSAGLGHFTLNTDGSWSYNAVNNQTAVQTLNAGESLTDSFTAITADGVETEITVTIDGADDGPAPLYVGGDIVTIGAEGNRAGPQAPFDLATLFSDDMGDDLSISVTGLPAHLSVTDGVLTQVSRPFTTTDARVHYVTVTATDTSGQNTSQLVQLSIAVDHQINLHLSGNFQGSNSADIVTFGDWRGSAHSKSFISLMSGDDIADFGGNTANFAEVVIDGGSGDDMLTFGDFAAGTYGELEVLGRLGDDEISFGASAAADNGIVHVFGDSSGLLGGADVIRFGTKAAETHGEVFVDAGVGNDEITFGSHAGRTNGTVEVQAGTGRDQITFGDNAENLTIRLGSDNDEDTLTFQGSVKNAAIHDWAQGTDTITFAAATGLWTARDSGGNKVFTSDDGQSFTVIGAAGVAAWDIVSVLDANEAPVFTGTTTPLLGTTGSLRSEDIAFDLASLFSDDRTDDLTISVSGLDARFTVIDGVLQPLSGHDNALSGQYSFTVTATDEHGLA